jgi:hypothetical protein
LPPTPLGATGAAGRPRVLALLAPVISPLAAADTQAQGVPADSLTPKNKNSPSGSPQHGPLDAHWMQLCLELYKPTS